MNPKQSAPRPRKAPPRSKVTGVRLPEELVLQAKYRALDERRTLREVVTQAIKDYLAQPIPK